MHYKFYSHAYLQSMFIQNICKIFLQDKVLLWKHAMNSLTKISIYMSIYNFLKVFKSLFPIEFSLKKFKKIQIIYFIKCILVNMLLILGIFKCE